MSEKGEVGYRAESHKMCPPARANPTPLDLTSLHSVDYPRLGRAKR